MYGIKLFFDPSWSSFSGITCVHCRTAFVLAFPFSLGIYILLQSGFTCQSPSKWLDKRDSCKVGSLKNVRLVATDSISLIGLVTFMHYAFILGYIYCVL